MKPSLNCQHRSQRLAGERNGLKYPTLTFEIFRPLMIFGRYLQSISIKMQPRASSQLLRNRVQGLSRTLARLLVIESRQANLTFTTCGVGSM
jgi:hypothetical protein